MNGVINSYMLGFYFGIMIVSSIMTMFAFIAVVYYIGITVAIVARAIQKCRNRRKK